MRISIVLQFFEICKQIEPNTAAFSAFGTDMKRFWSFWSYLISYNGVYNVFEVFGIHCQLLGIILRFIKKSVEIITFRTLRRFYWRNDFVRKYQVWRLFLGVFVLIFVALGRQDNLVEFYNDYCNLVCCNEFYKVFEAFGIHCHPKSWELSVDSSKNQ